MPKLTTPKHTPPQPPLTWKARGQRILRPRTKMGKVALWSFGLSLILRIPHWITHTRSGFWPFLFAGIFLFCAIWLLFGWARRRLLWRLRHRLIASYIFIGVFPLTLILAMMGISGYIFAGQFAAYIATSHLQSEGEHLAAANSAVAARLGALDRAGKLTPELAKEIAAASGEAFPHRSVTLWRDEEPTILIAADPDEAAISRPDDSIRENFSGEVNDVGGFCLRAVKTVPGAKKPLTLISSLPVTGDLLQPATDLLGSVTLFGSRSSGDTDDDSDPPKNRPAHHSTSVHAGSVTPAVNVLDIKLPFYTLMRTVDWQNGTTNNGPIGVVSRPSALYRTLFAALGDQVQGLEYFLFGLILFFGLIEFVALLIGLWLSRSITRSVAKLYDATEHVNRGDFTHRIKVRTRDQMAALEHSFNSMTDSLVKLLAEQKEKQRLESELEIAHQVQDLLFPQKSNSLVSLEVFGVCRPARSVSGDYYDFIPVGADRIVLAMGDISGKGVSAALLMATVHAFVRAYSLDPGMVGPQEDGLGANFDGDRAMYYLGGGPDGALLAPGKLMTTLNYQLFRSTPPEKYATMFLACYDAASQQLTYCNAGHLPPMLLKQDGRVFRLDVSGTVVGLFDGATYDKSAIAMQPGDLFLAFSDGVTEPENEHGEFGEDRLINLIRQHREQPLARIGEVILDAVTAWIGEAEQPDDVTVVLARAR